MPKAKESNPEFVSVNYLAEVYGVTTRQIQKWATELPDIERVKGQYNLKSVIRTIYKLQRATLEGKGSGSLNDKRGVKLDKDIHLLDLEIADKEKKFVDALDLEKSLGKVFVEFKNIRLIPRSYAQQIAGICLSFITGILGKKLKKVEIPVTEKKKLAVEIETLLTKQIDKALESLSRGFDSRKKKWGK